MAVIIISGTPGTGKTALARLIEKRLRYERIDVNNLVAAKRLSEGYDKKRGCQIVDTDKLNKELIRIIGSSKSKNLVIDSHLSHYLPPKYVDLCIVAKCSLKELKRRLDKRYKDKAKVRENLESEIFDICYNEAKELGHRVFVVDTSKKVDFARIKAKLPK